MRHLTRKLALSWQLPSLALLVLGYSVTVIAGDAILSWNANPESDLAGYAEITVHIPNKGEQLVSYYGA